LDGFDPFGYRPHSKLRREVGDRLDDRKGPRIVGHPLHETAIHLDLVEREAPKVAQ